MTWPEYVLRAEMVRIIIYLLLSIVLAVYLWFYLWNKSKRDKASNRFLISKVIPILICKIMPIIIVLHTLQMTVNVVVDYCNMEENM